MDELKFSKRKQVSGFDKQDTYDADRQFKFAVACAWVQWLQTTMLGVSLDDMWGMDAGASTGNRGTWKDFQLDHIVNKTHGDRYNLLNAQLLTPETHRLKTDSGEYTDFRPANFVLWLKNKIGRG